MIFSFPFLPISVNKAYATNFITKRRYKTSDYTSFLKDCAYYIPKQFKTLTEPLNVEINVYYPDNRRRDIDNIIKSTFDMLTYYGVWKDDSQVKRLVVESYYQKGKPETVIEIKPFQTPHIQ